jgi:ribonucleases P/MRP protein subunit RPP40
MQNLSYKQRLDRLNLTTLEERRSRGDLIETFKLLKGKENIEYKQFFQ